ncbi:hypothetical protein V2O64_07305 [Verrucomicrobiaceae bacterium 227]
MISHLMVFGGAWLVSSSRSEREQGEGPPLLSTRVAGGSAGGLSLSRLLREVEVGPSRYEVLKGQLAPAENHREVVLALLKKLPERYRRGGSRESDQEDDRIAEFEVRVRHWLAVDREACLEFLRSGHDLGNFHRDHPVFASAFADYGLEVGEVEWVIENVGGQEKIYWAKLKKLGVAGFLKEYGRDFRRGWSKLVGLYETLDFKDRGEVWAAIIEGDGSWAHKTNVLRSYLSNREHQGREVTAWIRELREGGGIPEAFRKECDGVFTQWLLSNPGAPLDERMALMESIDSLRMPVAAMVARSVEALLNEGRDWRYEFRHGRVDAHEVLNDLMTRLATESPEVEAAMRSSLFYQLVGQDSIGAMELLEPLPKYRQEEVLLRAIGMGFQKDDPVLAKAYYDSFPEAADEAEELNRVRNWDQYVQSGLGRYGDDFVDWVAAMPEGEFKERSIKSMVTHASRRGLTIEKRLREEFEEQ